MHASDILPAAPLPASHTATFGLASDKLTRLSGSEENPAPIRVLVVEDSRTVRHQLRGYLQQLKNVSVVEAETLAETRQLLENSQEAFFCAILDLTLPDASGSEIVDLVQRFAVPSIVLTGTVDPMVRQAVMERRVIDYMFKTGAAAIEEVAYMVGRLRQNHGNSWRNIASTSSPPVTAWRR